MTHADADATTCPGRLWYHPVRQRGRPFAVEPRLVTIPGDPLGVVFRSRCDRCRRVVFVPLGRIGERAG